MLLLWSGINNSHITNLDNNPLVGAGNEYTNPENYSTKVIGATDKTVKSGVYKTPGIIIMSE